jgi:hypothetical protein
MSRNQQRRGEADPPFLSWNALYALVILTLVLQIAAFAVLTAIFG